MGWKRDTSKDSAFHEKWCGLDYYSWGDRAALCFLRSRGFELTTKWTWVKPRPVYWLDELEVEAIAYLRHQWKFGGLDDGTGQVVSAPETAARSSESG